MACNRLRQQSISARERSLRKNRVVTSSPAAMDFTAFAGHRFPAEALTIYDRDYPFGWLGILAQGAAFFARTDLRLPRPRIRRCSACARLKSAGYTFNAARMRTLRFWPERREIWGKSFTNVWQPTEWKAYRRTDNAKKGRDWHAKLRH